MKKASLFLSLFIIVTLACNFSVNIPTNPAPQPTETTAPTIEPATTTPEIFISLTQAMPATVVPTAVQSVEVTVDPLTISLPSTLATGVRGIQVPHADGQDIPYFELTPGHTELQLEGYVLQGKFHEPKIYVYPALEYAQLVPAAFESMHRLRNIMNPGASISADQLPAVPFFNAAQVFASNIQLLSFQNVEGVRFLTEYAQYAAPVNNHDLFYHFEGFTSDGEYYIIAIFPVTAPGLAETSEAGAAVPAGGIALPDINDPNADWKGYYSAVTNLLNATSPQAFTPTLDQLDALIQSMRITQ
jgi:hypothetical protein